MIVGNLWGATELFGKAGATTNVDENAQIMLKGRS